MPGSYANRPSMSIQYTKEIYLLILKDFLLTRASCWVQWHHGGGSWPIGGYADSPIVRGNATAPGLRRREPGAIGSRLVIVLSRARVSVPTRLSANVLITLFARPELGIQPYFWGVTAVLADAWGNGRGRNGSWILSHSSVHSAPAGA